MKVLFLDLDGVLNPHVFDKRAASNTLDKDKVILLGNVLDDTDAKVVLTSAWRYLVHRGDMTLAGLDWLLRSHGFPADRLIDITRPDTMRPTGPELVPLPHPNERGQQITDWLAANPGVELYSEKPGVEAYAAVDDLDLGIRAAGHPLVLTVGSVGLTADDAAKLVELLGKC